ncbi:hypothetical protein GXW71_19840 [Roseomonas hellenica]|uniref:Uncharacterized protein n=1 Tax=Plastoroseomonas hellenica TaxID=2687306 RepID=A0ABS5F225_9PROT|nr:hypothetical protein [Plastoroseomonas hellenica]MBR0666621.1 hypothetical protein [Plastoroseomonas hellenica]
MVEPFDSAGAAMFRTTLAELGFTIGGFAKFMIRNGDCRPASNIKRRLRRMATGEVHVSGEMHVILGMLRNGRARAVRRDAEMQECPPPTNEEACRDMD